MKAILDKLTEIEKCAAAATEGPWTRKNLGVRFPNGWEGYRRIMPQGFGGGDSSLFQKLAIFDADFIAEARTTNPAMAKALRSALQALQYVADSWDGKWLDVPDSTVAEKAIATIAKELGV